MLRRLNSAEQAHHDMFDHVKNAIKQGLLPLKHGHRQTYGAFPGYLIEIIGVAEKRKMVYFVCMFLPNGEQKLLVTAVYRGGPAHPSFERWE